MIRRLIASRQLPTMMRGAEYLAPHLQPGERIEAAGWCAAATPNEVWAATASSRSELHPLQIAALVLFVLAGLSLSLFIEAATTRSWVLAGIGLLLLLGTAAGGAVLQAATWVLAATSGAEEARLIGLVGSNPTPSWYVAVSDRRFLMLASDTRSKKPKPGEFWSCSLADVRCTSTQRAPLHTLVAVELTGNPRELVVFNEFAPLTAALSRLRPASTIG